MRLIEHEDIPEIADWLLRMHDESPVFKDIPVDLSYSAPILEQAIKSSALFGVIEPGQGMMLGMVSRTWYDPRLHAFEQLIYVLPQRRGGMLAVRLVKAFEIECKNRGAIDITVGNSAGIVENLDRLYKALGYKYEFGSLTKRL